MFTSSFYYFDSLDFVLALMDQWPRITKLKRSQYLKKLKLKLNFGFQFLPFACKLTCISYMVLFLCHFMLALNVVKLNCYWIDLVSRIFI